MMKRLQPIEVEIVDSRQPEALARIAAAQPSVVILDYTDLETAGSCSLGTLLLSLPRVTAICLDPQGDRVHVVTSDLHTVVKGSELADVVQQFI